MKETFGQRLARLRKEKGYTQEDIASRITISPQAVSKWENDLSSPDILVLSSLADILDTSVDVLLGREEESNNININNKDNNKEEGIHLKDDEGNEVHIASDGHIHLKDEKGHTINKTLSKSEKVSWIVSTTIFGLALIGYILMGLLWKDNNIGWKVGWVLFLLGPVVGSACSMVIKRKITHFAYPLLIVMVYCGLGILGQHYGFKGWEVYWFLFLTIPAYYIIGGVIDKYVFKSKEDDED